MQLKRGMVMSGVLALGLYAALDSMGSTGPAPGEKFYLFAYFKGSEVSFREDGEVFKGGVGLHLAWSEDGLKWKKAARGRLFFKPRVSRMLRDPFVAMGPDGIFHLVWTTGWKEGGIGYASSPDLIHWSDERILPVMADEPTTLNCWAPEIFYDAAAKNFLVFWSSTIPGRFPETQGSGDNGYNHRIYYTTTPDFKTLAPTRLLYDPGFECIDADMVRAGDKYVMFLKNETRHPPAKFIVMAESDRAEGPYGLASAPLTRPGVWAEGPAAVKIKETWHLYFDMYASNKYGLLVSEDLVHWADQSHEVKMPRGARHGNVFEVSETILAGLNDLR